MSHVKHGTRVLCDLQIGRFAVLFMCIRVKIRIHDTCMQNPMGIVVCFINEILATCDSKQIQHLNQPGNNRFHTFWSNQLNPKFCELKKKKIWNSLKNPKCLCWFYSNSCKSIWISHLITIHNSTANNWTWDDEHDRCKRPKVGKTNGKWKMEFL